MLRKGSIMSKVGIKRSESYDIDKNLKELTELSEAFDLDRVKDRDLLLVFDFPPPDASLLTALIRLFKDKQAATITAGTTLFGSKPPLEISSAFHRENVNLVDFRFAQYEKMDIPFRKERFKERYRGYSILSPGQYAQEKAVDKMEAIKTRAIKNAYLPVSFADADFLIPVVKMKDSPVSKIGGFANLLLKVVPTITRTEILMHLLDRKFPDALIDVLSIVKEKVIFGLVDGVEAIVSDDIDVNKMNVLLASDDLLSLDAVFSVLLGFNSSEIDTNRIGDIYGVGAGLLSGVTMYGDDFMQLQKDVKKKLRYSMAFSRKRLFPRIVVQESSKLDELSQFCPTGAIQEVKPSNYAIAKEKCINCNFCVEISEGTIQL